MILTPAESKRLIAKAVANMPIVQAALKNGKVIITKGTTNSYIAEEILNITIKPGALVSGMIIPQNAKDPFSGTASMPEIILVRGKQSKMTLNEAMQQLKPGDIVIKGANALDYQNKTAAVMIGAPDGGTTGKIMPYITARKAHLIIPVGLEKQISGNVVEMHLKMREPLESISHKAPSMFLLTGHIITEIESIKILVADLEVFQAAAGGVGGAEGSIWLVVRGDKNSVEKAIKIAKQVQGEPPFGKEK
ncbi:MAG: hypothetical protein A2Y10_17675 [Planctomycetes bacterium GWF2_41_51]|nr:MAG: hypothetical protein A2Y10_17675 [Planctomycetes bacterium GWF2_41_51]